MRPGVEPRMRMRLRLVCSQCAMGQLVRGIRLGDRPHMRSSAFARTCVQRHLRIDPFSVPRRSFARPSASRRDARAQTSYRTQRSRQRTLGLPSRLPTWHAHDRILVSIVACMCIRGGSFDRFSIYGFRSAILRACMLACRSTAQLFLRSIPPGPRDMATRVAVATAGI